MLSGVLMPFYAEGNDILFLAGKGCVIAFFANARDILNILIRYD